MSIRAKHYIDARGYNIQKKHALVFSTQQCLHSLTPAMVLTPEWNVRMQFGPGKNKPIYVIGSGKTAMEVVYRYTKRFPDSIGRFRCIAGRGTFFVNRNKLLTPTDFWERHM